MISQSHEATATDLQLAAEGKLLEKLNSTQSSDIETISLTGTPAKRAPHSGGDRRVGGPIKKINYSLVEQEFTTIVRELIFLLQHRNVTVGGSALEQLHAELV